MSWKKEFYQEHGFYPHQEACKECGKRRADHTVWNTRLAPHGFVPTGRKACNIESK